MNLWFKKVTMFDFIRYSDTYLQDTHRSDMLDSIGSGRGQGPHT